MLNLLPQTEKNRLIDEYKRRYYTMVALSFCLLSAVAIVGLFPSYLSKKAERELIIKQADKEDEQNSVEILAEAERLAASNKVFVEYLTSRVGELKSTTKASKIVQDVLAKSTSAISLFGISIDGKSVTVRGRAATRSDLIDFHTALKTEPMFKDAVLPVSDLAKSTRAEFTITIEMP